MCNLPNQCPSAGIRRHSHISWNSKPTKEWNREALKGLTYLCTDRGPLKHWLYKVGRADSDRCACDPGVIQNSAHILKCRLVGDGKH